MFCSRRDGRPKNRAVFFPRPCIAGHMNCTETSHMVASLFAFLREQAQKNGMTRALQHRWRLVRYVFRARRSPYEPPDA